jgi:hypothetical protein
MATTRDPVGEFVDLPEADADPTVVGQIGYRSGAFRLRDSIGVFDPRSGGGGLTEVTHRPVDQLVHEIAETSYEEYEYTGSRVDAVRIYTDDTKVTKVREQEFTYTGNKVTQIVTKQYNVGGSVVETLTETFNYTGNTLNDIDRVLS